MPPFGRPLGAALARLFERRTTLDPFLDDSDPSVHRLGEISLHGIVHDALAASPAQDIVVEIQAAPGSRLSVPCAVIGAPGAQVMFDVAAAQATGRESRRVSIDAESGRWHEILLRVPAGRPEVTLRTSVLRAVPGARAVWGVPSLTWRRSLRGILRSAAFAVRAYGLLGSVERLRATVGGGGDADYAAWAERSVPGADEIAALRAHAAALASRPRVALILEEDAGPDLPRRLAGTLRSLEAQVYADWEIWMRPEYAELVAPPSSGCLRVIPGPPGDEAGARNAALAGSAADFVGVMTAGDCLPTDALFRVAERLASEPDVDVLYSDEDVRPPDGRPARPRFKPGWSPEYLRSRMYLGRLLLVRRTLAQQAGGYRSAFSGALDYDLSLRVTATARRVAHVARVLYHRGDGASLDRDGAHAHAGAALADSYATAGIAADVVRGARPGIWRARVALTGTPRVAIVLPTDGQRPDEREAAFVTDCARALRERTAYRHYELLICDNGNLSADVLSSLATVPHRRATYSWEGPFNFPRKLNFAVAQTDAPYVLLLNDDVEPINAGWLDAMLEYAQQPHIGAVGAKLFYPDGRLQHVGVATGVCGVAAHLLHQHPGGTAGCDGMAFAVRNCSAVTGACLLTRRAVFDEAGGFDERLALDFNDVDFCLRVRQRGYRIVFTPHARLFHRESASFGARRQRPAEIAAMREKWGGTLDRDPYYNVNLSRRFADCRPELAPVEKLS